MRFTRITFLKVVSGVSTVTFWTISIGIFSPRLWVSRIRSSRKLPALCLFFASSQNMIHPSQYLRIKWMKGYDPFFQLIVWKNWRDSCCIVRSAKLMSGLPNWSIQLEESDCIQYTDTWDSTFSLDICPSRLPQFFYLPRRIWRTGYFATGTMIKPFGNSLRIVFFWFIFWYCISLEFFEIHPSNPWSLSWLLLLRNHLRFLSWTGCFNHPYVVEILSKKFILNIASYGL